VSLRLAALATLGALGDATDLPPLHSSAGDPDARIRHAARNALSHYKATRGNPAQEDSTP
jgi:HEAT repeat protein